MMAVLKKRGLSEELQHFRFEGEFCLACDWRKIDLRASAQVISPRCLPRTQKLVRWSQFHCSHVNEAIHQMTRADLLRIAVEAMTPMTLLQEWSRPSTASLVLDLNTRSRNASYGNLLLTPDIARRQQCAEKLTLGVCDEGYFALTHH